MKLSQQSTNYRRRAARTFALGTLAAAALVATGIGAGAARADAPPPGTIRSIVAQGQTSITTDKASYVVGEPITVTYTLPGPGQIRITDRQGSQLSTLRSGYSAQANGTIQGTVTPPLGQECLTLEYTGARTLTEMPFARTLVEDPSGQGGQSGPASAETCFQVTDKAASKDLPQTPSGQGQGQGQPPAKEQGQAAGVYTLRSKVSDNLLDSSAADKRVWSLTANGSRYQQWKLEPAPDGYVFLRDDATLYALDGTAAGPNDLAPYLYVKPFNGSANQQFKVEQAADGYVFLRNRANNLVLVQSAPLNGKGLINLGALPAGEQPGPQAQWKLTAVQP